MSLADLHLIDRLMPDGSPVQGCGDDFKLVPLKGSLPAAQYLILSYLFPKVLAQMQRAWEDRFYDAVDAYHRNESQVELAAQIRQAEEKRRSAA